MAICSYATKLKQSHVYYLDHLGLGHSSLTLRLSKPEFKAIKSRNSETQGKGRFPNVAGVREPFRLEEILALFNKSPEPGGLAICSALGQRVPWTIFWPVLLLPFICSFI